MSLSERTSRLLLSALGSPEARDELVSDITDIQASEIADSAITTAKLAALAVTDAKVATGIDAAKIGGGAVSNAEFAFLDGVTSSIQTQLGTKLATASFTDTAVTGKLITGFTAGSGTVAATDTILQAINKIDGNVSEKPSYQESSFNANFDHSIGLIACVVRKVAKQITVEITTASTADGDATVIASGVALDAAYRPVADLSFPVVVTDNGVKVFGKLVVASAGTLTFSASAAGAGFTDAAVAGWDRVAVTYTLA